MMAFIEGLFAVYIAKPTTISSIGGIAQSTLVLAGAQLAVIGAVMMLVWFFFTDKRMEGQLGKVFSIIMLLASVLMIVEGIAATYLSSDIMIGSVQGVSKKFVALAGVQLFMIGMIQFSLWMRRNEERRNWLFEWGGLVLTVVLIGEGLLVIGVSADTAIAGIGTVSKSTIFIVGLQLSLLSGILFVMQLFRERGLFAVRLGMRRMNVIFSLLALAIAFEGLVLAYYAEPLTLSYSDSLMDGFRKLLVSMVAAQLFAIGLLVFSSWKLTREKLDRKNMVEFFGMGSGIVLAAEGAFVLGISGNTVISNGLGGIVTRTVMIAGLGLVLLGLLVLFSWHYRNNHIVKRIAGSGRIDVLILVVSLITGLGGVVLSAISANVVIEGVGGISARYIELGGIQLILLASIVVLMWALRTEGISLRMKRVSYMAALFMMLLIPPAILL